MTAYLQIVLSLALCLGTNAFSVIPAKYWHKPITHRILDASRSDNFHEKFHQQLVSIGSFKVSMAPNFSFLHLLSPLSAPKPIGRQYVAKEDEFSTKQAKKYNDDPCDDISCAYTCNNFFDKDYGFCPELQWCVCYD